jgi:hypothetical protein
MHERPAAGDTPFGVRRLILAIVVLRIPLDTSRGPNEHYTRVAIENDMTTIAGRRSVISFKVTLPRLSPHAKDYWCWLVVDGGHGERPRATAQDAAAAILESPRFEVGCVIDGRIINEGSVYMRTATPMGPYQVVVVIDNAPETRSVHGAAPLTIMANELEILKAQRVDFGKLPRLTFQTCVVSTVSEQGFAEIDDFSLSVEDGALMHNDAVGIMPPFVDPSRTRFEAGGHFTFHCRPIGSQSCCPRGSAW